jgi:transcriptional regulator with XRE-family HTH domain
MAQDDAAFIREARETLGLTQVQLADELGVTERLISMYENGRALPPGRRRHLELLLRSKRKR